MVAFRRFSSLPSNMTASAAFLQLASGGFTDPDVMDRWHVALRAYCERDTLAMAKRHRALILPPARATG